MNTVRIGLVRHFEVKKAMPSGWMTFHQLLQWLEDYNATDVIIRSMDLGGIPWAHCFSSDIRRAHLTAQTVFSGTITPLPQLREASVLPFQTGNLNLPYWAWRSLLRVAWATAHKSQRPARDEFLLRIRETAEMLCSQDQDTLVVCHAGTMYFLRKELLRRGFTGPKFALAENARLYVFQKSSRHATVH
jgi:broad specificity phosphatase PhoE